MVRRIELSKRLLAIASQVDPYSIVADVGTDHGYIPIYLAQTGVIPKIFALDIHSGPLERAERNVLDYQVAELVFPVRSNGLMNVSDEKIDCIIIAGMGGMLVCEILEQAREQLTNVSQMILSPHLDVVNVRKKVHDLGFQIDSEEIVVEQSKFYPIIICRKGKELYSNEIDYLYGKKLIETRNHTLLQQLETRNHHILELQRHLVEHDSAASQNKLKVLNIERIQIDEVMKCLLS